MKHRRSPALRRRSRCRRRRPRTRGGRCPSAEEQVVPLASDDCVVASPPRTMSSPAKASTKSLPARAQNHVRILGPGQHLGRARSLDRAVGPGLGRRAQQPHGGQRQPDDACDCKEPLSSPATSRLEGPRARSSSRHRRTQPVRYTGDVGRARRRRTSGLPIPEAPTILAWVGVRGFVRSFEFGVTERRRV